MEKHLFKITLIDNKEFIINTNHVIKYLCIEDIDMFVLYNIKKYYKFDVKPIFPFIIIGMVNNDILVLTNKSSYELVSHLKLDFPKLKYINIS